MKEKIDSKARIGVRTAAVVSPTRKQEDQMTPVRKGAIYPEHVERLRRPPGAGHTTKPYMILPAAIEPDYRSRKYLLRRMHASIVRAPRFHAFGIHGVDRIIIASRPHGVVVPPRRVVHEQAT